MTTSGILSKGFPLKFSLQKSDETLGASHVGAFHHSSPTKAKVILKVELESPVKE
jgi:hypothetical protein